MNNAAFGKTMKNVRKHSDIKLVTTEASTKPNQYQNQTIKQQSFFSENLLAAEMRKTQILMNKPVYLGL